MSEPVVASSDVEDQATPGCLVGSRLIRVNAHVIGQRPLDVSGVEEGIRFSDERLEARLVGRVDFDTAPQRVERGPGVRSGYPVRLQGRLHLETLDHLVRKIGRASCQEGLW